MDLAEQAGLSDLLDEHVRFGCERVKAGADSIDDLNVVRCGGMTQVFTDVYAAATLGILLPTEPTSGSPGDRAVRPQPVHGSWIKWASEQSLGTGRSVG
jgi:hypothetical protein